MSLLKLYSLIEAGVLHKHGEQPKPRKPKKKSAEPFPHAAGMSLGSLAAAHQHAAAPEDDDEGEFSSEDDEDDLGPDMDYEDPSPEDEPPSRHPDPVRPPKPFKEPEREVPVFGKSAKPSKALQGGKTAGSLKVDRRTLEALEQALENVRTSDDDLQSWIDDTLSEIGRAIRNGSELTLPKFEAASDDDVGDDDSGDED